MACMLMRRYAVQTGMIGTILIITPLQDLIIQVCDVAESVPIDERFLDETDQPLHSPFVNGCLGLHSFVLKPTAFMNAS